MLIYFFDIYWFIYSDVFVGSNYIHLTSYIFEGPGLEPLKENLAQVGSEPPSADSSGCHTLGWMQEPTAFMSVILNIVNVGTESRTAE